MLQRVISWYTGFLPQFKDMLCKVSLDELHGISKLSILYEGVCECVCSLCRISGTENRWMVLTRAQIALEPLFMTNCSEKTTLIVQ